MKSQFRTLLMILPSEAPPYYEWNNWKQVFPVLTELVLTADKKPAMELIQSSNNKAFKNPRSLLWNEKNMEKWTHGSPLTSCIGNQIDFFAMDIWAPSYTKFLESKKAPLLLIQLCKRSFLRDSTANSRQLFMIAAQKKFIEQHETLYKSTVSQIMSLMRPCVSVVVDSPWVYKKTEFNRRTLENPLQFFRSDWDYSPKTAREIFDLDGAQYTLIEFGTQ